MVSRRAIRGLVITCVLAIAIAASCGGSSNDAGSTPPPSPDPTATTAPVSAETVPVRLQIPEIDLDANVVILGGDDGGKLGTPNSPFDVAWHPLSGMPGAGKNAVFSGHLDYPEVGPAVFWDLHRLRAGDIVNVLGEDGSIHLYAVVWMKEYSANPGPGDLQEILGPTETESVTLMTPAGAFDPLLGAYSLRLVVRAELVPMPQGTP